MTTTPEPDDSATTPEPTDTASDVMRWTHGLCWISTLTVDDVAYVMALDTGSAQRLGRQVFFPRTDRTPTVELVLDHAEQVLFAEVATDSAVSIEALSAATGPGRRVPCGPHSPTATLLFPAVEPGGAARSCVIAARVLPEQPDLALSIVLSPRSH